LENNVDPTAAIFHVITLPDQLVVILKLPNSEEILLHTTQISQPQMEATLKTLRRELGRSYPSPSGKAIGQQVYDWVIRPMESLLTQNQVETLVFVLDGSLRSVPMAALYDGQHYLIEKFAIALTPNSQLFTPQPLNRDNLTVQSFGISDFQADNPEAFPHHKNFGDLPYVTEELAQLQQYASGNEFLNNQFTRSALQTQIRQSAPIVHIATHGQFSSDPRETFIVAWDEQIDVLTLSSILRTHQEEGATPIELLVLSACQTAAGDDRAVLGLAGIAIQSGARSTLSSLWVIQDQSTAILMELFYQALNNPDTPVTRAEALRQAQLQLMKIPGYVAPYYWAPYVMVGGWL
ncbi:MAG: CHAT domain-containing protein, partial [Cyanobacteria bacterium J06642_11]